MSKKKSGVGKFVLGAAVGASLGILFAPEKGEKTRKELKKKMDELLQKIKEVDKEEVKIQLETKLNELKAELEDLDKEKVLKIAKEKSEALVKKAGELKEYAKEKGTPVLEKAAESVRQEAVKATKAVLAKLEKDQG